MSERNELLKREEPNWNEIYSKYDLTEIPWHSDKPDRELIELIEDKIIEPCVVLDLGCGAGTDAIYLASKGFDVIALDISQEAIRIAKERAGNAGVKVKFIVGNFLEVKLNTESFEFINDRGCLPHINPLSRENFAIKINRILKTNGYYYLRCWSDQEKESKTGPCRPSKNEIKEIFSKYFKLGKIIDIRFSGKGARGYACLMKKEVHE